MEKKEEKKEVKKEFVVPDAIPKAGFERPVMVHRAMLGSVERMFAVLCEHYGGKWPFWLSPRQVLIVPIKDGVNDYCAAVGKELKRAGYHVEVRRYFQFVFFFLFFFVVQATGCHVEVHRAPAERRQRRATMLHE